MACPDRVPERDGPRPVAQLPDNQRLLDDSRESTRPEAPRERLRPDAPPDRSGGWSKTVGRLRIVLPPAGKDRLAGATGVGRERTEHGRDREA